MLKHIENQPISIISFIILSSNVVPVAPQETSIEEILLRFFRYKVLLWYYIIYSSYFVSLYYLLSTNRHLLNGIYISIMRKRRRSDHVQGTADGHKQSRLLQDKK